MVGTIWLQSDLIRRYKTEMGLIGRAYPRYDANAVKGNYDSIGYNISVEYDQVNFGPGHDNYINPYEYSMFSCKHEIFDETLFMDALENKFAQYTYGVDGNDPALSTDVAAFASYLETE